MMLASVLLLQIFTESITPKTPGQCVGVVYQNRVLLAKSVARSRFTGRLVLTMPGKPLPFTEAQTSSCSNVCFQEVSATNSCVASCGARATIGERDICGRSCMVDVEPTPPPLNVCLAACPDEGRGRFFSDCSRRCRVNANRMYFSPGWSPMKVCENKCLQRLPVVLAQGRDIEIPKAEAISNPSGCTCTTESCIDH